MTILDRLDRHARERADRPALLEPRSATFDAWDTLTWSEYAARVRQVARGFIALGHQPPDAVGIIGPNRTAWVLADLGAIMAGGLPAGIYATATAEQTEYILGHATASIAVVVDDVQAAKVLSVRAKLPHLKAIVLFPGAKKPANHDGFVYTWDELLAKASETPAERLDALRAEMKANNPATLIYTSGTTGPPKAVALSHENLTWTGSIVPQLVDVGPGDRGVSYLPLAHIAEQMISIHGPLTLAMTVHFVPVMEQLADALRAVRPHFIFGVPRVWEKIQAKVEAGVTVAPASKQRMFRLAQKVGLPVTKARFEGRTPPLVEGLAYRVFDKLVYSKFRERLGLDHARVLVTGAAPMPPATKEWFLSVGLAISDVYGQSEDTGPTSFNRYGQGRIGTVGKPIPGAEVKIAPDGEIWVKGPNVFLGYYRDPAATAEVLEDGWLKSGDVGELDPDGFLKITDRKKDLIITAGGKNISPQNIEKMLTSIPIVSQAVVIGDQRKYLAALVTLVPEELERFAKANGLSGDLATLSAHPRVRDELQQRIDRDVNPKLAQYETIKRFEILPAELSEAAGELTPTMKIKRKVVNARHSATIERMYEGT
ncbi:long-chain fatty acid--CoA ligase [Myxococcota bacterium]|nr:long-chain fatty acid--CoA ligase [Myxococcota bacterium]